MTRHKQAMANVSDKMNNTPWVICDSLEEARKERVKLAFRFISREVVIRDENLNLIQLF